MNQVLWYTMMYLSLNRNCGLHPYGITVNFLFPIPVELIIRKHVVLRSVSAKREDIILSLQELKILCQ